MTLYPVFSRRVVRELEKRGFNVIKMAPNKKYTHLIVYYFEETPARSRSASKRRPSNVDADDAVDSVRRLGSHAIKACKIEEDLLPDNADATFDLFESLLDSARQGA